MKKFLRVLSLVMVFALFVQIMPMSVIAEGVRSPEDAGNSFSQNPIKGEIIELRDKHTKVFERQDGSKIAVVSAEAIHFEKDGKMTDVDNTLVETKQADGNVLKNTASSLSVELPTSLENEKEIKLQSDGYSLSFAFLGNITSNRAKIADNKQKNDASANDASAEAVKKTKPEKKNASVKYENILENIDVEYVVQPESLKENIIVKSKPKKPLVFTYVVKAPNLTAQLNEDNSLDFYAGNDNTNIVFHLPAPFMQDKNNQTSYDVKVELNKNNNGEYSLAYKPSAEWLADTKTAYPVVVDPVIQVPGSASTMEDVYVISAAPANNYGVSSLLRVKKDEKATLLRLKDLNLGADNSAVITKAQIHLNSITSGMGANEECNIAVREITSGTSWAENGVTWNSYLSMSKGPIVDIRTIIGNQQGYISWDITKLVKKWQSNNTLSNGMVFEAENLTSMDVVFGSRTNTDAELKPYYTLEYRSVSGISYGNGNHMQNIGRAGTAYVNDYSGALSIARTDLAFGGSRMPVDITWFYNSNLNSYNFGFGNHIHRCRQSDNTATNRRR